MNPHSVTLADHLAIETEGSVSPIQQTITRLSLDAERRKARLLADFQRHCNHAAFLRRELARVELAAQECANELSELS
jgi:hypothetical protein